MISAIFFKKEKEYKGFKVSGHAGYATKGPDIVCAAVSSAVQLTINGITEVLMIPGEIKVDQKDAMVSLRLACKSSEAQLFLKALYLHIEDLAGRYKGYIELKELEV